MEWFINIEKQPLEITKAADNTLITSHPEDMFNVIHVQVCLSSFQLCCTVLHAITLLYNQVDCIVGSKCSCGGALSHYLTLTMSVIPSLSRPA
jgi:hypothetical protein